MNAINRNQETKQHEVSIQGRDFTDDCHGGVLSDGSCNCNQSS